MLENGKFLDCISAFAKYGMPLIGKNFQKYQDIALEIFAECDPKEILSLRTALFNFCRNLTNSSEKNNELTPVKLKNNINLIFN